MFLEKKQSCVCVQFESSPIAKIPSGHRRFAGDSRSTGSFFHANVAGFNGGFVGVDIFFVISGFLIASIIAKDVELKRFSFVLFYERRMRRIFPALFAEALFCVAAATVLYEPKDFAKFGKSLMAMTAFISNLFFKREAGTDGYFGFDSARALLHTWSLSVEEQFYIFFPVGLILLRRWAKEFEINCLLFAIAASFALSAWGAIPDASA